VFRFEAIGHLWELHPASYGTYEGLYRADAAFGASNPCFILLPWFGPWEGPKPGPCDAARMLGRKLSGNRHGIKDPEAIAILRRARREIAGRNWSA
jgi:hypothetical protein